MQFVAMPCIIPSIVFVPTLAREKNVCPKHVLHRALGRVQFIGSIGFLAFLAMRRVPGVQNVVLCCLNENVKELFMICRLIPSANVSSAPFQDSASVQSALEWCDDGGLGV